jgi:gamma-polyglutamate synthase
MPELQEINQVKLIKSTIGVLSNVREDHLAEMGPTLDDVARSLSRSMPAGGICVTAERERLHILQQEAAKRNCKLVVVDPDSVSDEDMAGFESITFKENVAIALAVADLLRVNRRSAMAGMWAAAPDPGVLTVTEYTVHGKVISLANVFAANDPESTLMNIDRLLDQGAITRPLHLVINCRPDRVERNQQMGALAERIDPDRIILIGNPTHSAMTTIHPRWWDRVRDLGGNRRPAELLRGIVAGVDRHAAVVTIGNIHGQGEDLLAAMDTLDRVRRDEPARRPITPVRPVRRNGTQVPRGDLYQPARPVHPRPHPHAGPPPPSRATPPALRNPRNRRPR